MRLEGEHGSLRSCRYLDGAMLVAQEPTSGIVHHKPRSLSPAWSSGPRPSNQWDLRSPSAIAHFSNRGSASSPRDDWKSFVGVSIAYLSAQVSSLHLDLPITCEAKFCHALMGAEEETDDAIVDCRVCGSGACRMRRSPCRKPEHGQSGPCLRFA